MVYGTSNLYRVRMSTFHHVRHDLWNGTSLARAQRYATTDAAPLNSCPSPGSRMTGRRSGCIITHMRCNGGGHAMQWWWTRDAVVVDTRCSGGGHAMQWRWTPGRTTCIYTDMKMYVCIHIDVYVRMTARITLRATAGAVCADFDL